MDSFLPTKIGLALCAIGLLVFPATPLFFRWRRRVGRLVLTLSAFIFVLGATILFLQPPGNKLRLYRFAQLAKANLAPEELRQWSLAQLSIAKKTDPDIIFDQKDVPAGIRNLKSENGLMEFTRVLSAESEEDAFVQFAWGGGFGNWGLEIGSPAYRPVSPAFWAAHSQNRSGVTFLDSEDNQGVYNWIEWKQGIYFFITN